MRIGQGWAEAARAVAQLLALLGWSMAGLPTSGRMSRASHRTACRILRRTEAILRRVLVVLARRAPVRKRRKQQPPAPVSNPCITRITLTPRGPLHHLLYPEPAPHAPEASRSREPTPRAPVFRLLEPVPALERREQQGSPPSAAPRMRAFIDGEWTCVDIGPERSQPDAPDLSEDRPMRHVARRLAAIQAVLADQDKAVKRVARWLARRADKGRAGQGRVLPIRLRKAPGMAAKTRRRRRQLDPPSPDLLDTLHHMALRARPPPDDPQPQT